LLRSEERLEDAVPVLAADADTGVSDLQQDLASLAPGLQGELAPARHSLDGVAA